MNISQLVCRLSNGMRLLLGVLMYVNISQLVSNGRLSSIKWYETTFRSTHVREYQSVGLSPSNGMRLLLEYSCT